MLKTKITTKKFYNKWMYKVTYKLPGIAVLRILNFSEIDKILIPQRRPIATFSKAAANYEFIKELCDLLSSFDSTEWSKRIERDYIDIYTNNKDLYTTLRSTLTDLITLCFEPTPDSLDILEKGNFAVVKKLPHNKYRYKAFLMPHRIKDKYEKQMYLNWIDQQGTKVLISDVVKDWFIRTEWNWDRRYLLVEDESTLLMLKLRNSEALGKIYEFIVSDK